MITGGLLLFLIPMQGWAQSAEREALDRYIQIALEQNPEVQARAAETDAARLEAPQAGSLMDPRLEFEYMTYERNPMADGTQIQLRAMQMFPWFGSLSTNREYYNQLAETNRMTLTRTENELVRDLKEIWFMMHEISHHIMILQENLELLSTIEQQVLSRLEGGGGSQVEALRVQIESDEIQNQIENMNDQLLSFITRFNKLLNRDAQESVQLHHDVEKRALPDTALAAALESNPEIRSLSFEERAAETNIERARQNGRPSFGVGFMVGHQNPGVIPDGVNTFELMLRIELPVYRGRYRAQQQQARHRLQAVQDFRENMINRVEADMAEAIRDYTTAERDAELFESKLIPATRQALDIALANYSSGATEFEQIIQLQRQILEYELDQSEAITRQNLAVAEIEFLMGGR